ncbi:hypothetical protein [Desertimonas flava]|uniref:hypothetical protein n=1 Tax=Desertimonas flava TaxID=2064846 RepID=UPI000E34EDEE|nr:hypothetical protein [Desertimonas flava]
MAKVHWRPEAADDLDGATVFVHAGFPDVRIQPGEHTDAAGGVWPHGVQVTVRDDEHGWLPVDSGSFFWVHEAEAWAERELAP